jgi:transposase
MLKADTTPAGDKELQNMPRPSQLDVEQRMQAVMALLRREEPAGKIARRLGVSEPTLYRWRDQFLDGAKAGLNAGRGKTDDRDRQIEQLHRQVAERDRFIGEQAIALRVLKKVQASA